MRILTGSLLLLWALSVPTFAQSPVNFSGKWKLNTEKSQMQRLPKSLVVVIDHKDPVFQYTATGENPDGDTFGETVKFTTDGRETVTDEGAKLSAHWEGSGLKMNYTSPDGSYVLTGTATLSKDGKTFERNATEKSPDGEGSRHEVFEKQ